MALLQDPLRKLTPDQPVVYVVLVGVVFGAAALAATMSGVSLMPRRIWGWRRYLAAPFGLFIAIVIFQAINAFARFGNVIIPLIGLSAYLTPFVALCFVYQMVVRSPINFLTNFFLFYIVCVFWPLQLSICNISAMTGQFLERWAGLIIYDRTRCHTLGLLRAVSSLRGGRVACGHLRVFLCNLDTQSAHDPS